MDHHVSGVAEQAEPTQEPKRHDPHCRVMPLYAAPVPAAEPTLTFSELSRASQSRAKRWHGGAPAWSLGDWMLALAGELGEACNIVKKLNRSRDGVVGNDIADDELRGKLRRELGDVMVYLDLAAQCAGVDLAGAVVEVFNAKSEKLGFPERLTLRAAERVSDDQAVKRIVAYWHAGACQGDADAWTHEDFEQAAANARRILAVVGGRVSDDTARLNYVLRDAMLAPTDGGDTLGLFLTTREEEKAFAIVAEATSEMDEESFTAEDVPFLSDEQRAHINGSIPDAAGCITDPVAIRAALDRARSALPTRKTSMLPCVELPDGQSDSGSTYIGLDLFLAIIREANTEPRT